MLHESLANLMQCHFVMMKDHNFSLTEIENMIPWERQIYMGLLINYVKEENERAKQQEASARSGM
jgi:hypothetical protein